MKTQRNRYLRHAVNSSEIATAAFIKTNGVIVKSFVRQKPRRESSSTIILHRIIASNITHLIKLSSCSSLNAQAVAFPLERIEFGNLRRLVFWRL